MAPKASVPTPNLPKSARTRQSILDAARIAFARKGFSAVTIRDITDLAQVTRANFYYYFQDKTELFVELGTATYREAVQVVESFGEPGATAKDAIRDWVVRYFAYLDRNGAFVIRSGEDSPDDRKFRAARARSHGRTAQALGDRIAKLSATPPESDPSAVGLTIMSMLERSWLIVQHNEIPRVSRETVVTALAELITRLTD